MGDSEINQDGIDELMHSDEMKDLMEEISSEVADAARLLAPKRTGKMAARIKSSTEDSTLGIIGKVTAPAPANLLSTASRLRHQVTAWGRPVSLWHKADNPFLRHALDVVRGVWD